MEKFDKQKMLEVVLFVLNETKGTDCYHLFKILYFADREHLSKWGRRIIRDDFYALKYGSVPSLLYDSIKQLHKPENDFGIIFSEVVDFAEEDASSMLVAKRNADTDYLSEAEKESLLSSIKTYQSKTFSELKTLSHGIAWQKACRTAKKIISTDDMAEEAGANADMLAYIKERSLLSASLS